MAKDDEMAAVAELICRLNPYTNQKWSKTTQIGTGDMQVCIGPADPTAAAQYANHVNNLDANDLQQLGTLSAKPNKNDQDNAALDALKKKQQVNKDAQTLASIAQISIEVERNYGGQWAFKGQAQTVKSAFRIPYRFPVQDRSGKTLYWQTEFLLIGYAGSDGGA